MTTIELITLAILGAAGLSIVWSSLRVGITPMPSSKKACRLLLKEVAVEEGMTIVDLGSGWGNLVLNFARQYRSHQVVGYELSFMPYLVSYFCKILFRLKNLELKRKNFLHADFPDDVILLCYLYPKGMEKLQKKLEVLPSNRRWLVSNTFALPGHKSTRTMRLNDLYSTPIYFYDLRTSAKES